MRLGILTVSIVRVFHSCHSTASKHHLVFCERAGLIRKDVLHLAEVFCDVQSSALQMRVRLFIVELSVLMNKIHLAYLHYFNGNKERDWDQDLERERDRKCVKGLSQIPIGSLFIQSQTKC